MVNNEFVTCVGMKGFVNLALTCRETIRVKWNYGGMGKHSLSCVEYLKSEFCLDKLTEPTFVDLCAFQNNVEINKCTRVHH
jgi:hypothetical protein